MDNFNGVSLEVYFLFRPLIARATALDGPSKRTWSSISFEVFEAACLVPLAEVAPPLFLEGPWSFPEAVALVFCLSFLGLDPAPVPPLCSKVAGLKASVATFWIFDLGDPDPFFPALAMLIAGSLLSIWSFFLLVVLLNLFSFTLS